MVAPQDRSHWPVQKTGRQRTDAHTWPCQGSIQHTAFKAELYPNILWLLSPADILGRGLAAGRDRNAPRDRPDFCTNHRYLIRMLSARPRFVIDWLSTGCLRLFLSSGVSCSSGTIFALHQARAGPPARCYPTHQGSAAGWRSVIGGDVKSCPIAFLRASRRGGRRGQDAEGGCAGDPRGMQSEAETVVRGGDAWRLACFPALRSVVVSVADGEG